MDVKIRCLCPPKADGAARHESDTVTLRATLDFRQATTIRNEVAIARHDDPGLSGGELLAILTEGYILYGVESWSVMELGERGKVQPREVNKPALREVLLSDPLLAEPIGEAADELYSPLILLPLMRRALASSEPTPETDSTSPRTTSQPKPPKPSKPSSTTTTATDGIATITSLPVGDSSSSQSSGTAA